MHTAREALELDHIFVVYPGTRRYYLHEKIDAIPLSEACFLLKNSSGP